jgi:hypothetical protein
MPLMTTSFGPAPGLYSIIMWKRIIRIGLLATSTYPSLRKKNPILTKSILKTKIRRKAKCRPKRMIKNQRKDWKKTNHRRWALKNRRARTIRKPTNKSIRKKIYRIRNKQKNPNRRLTRSQ